MNTKRIHETTRISGPVLGDRVRFGCVGYAGEAFAPAEGTYAGVRAGHAKMTTIQDSGQDCGRTRLLRGELAKLYPLAAAMLWEVAFAREAGPLDTWRN
jgi:hypothetical protein